MNDMYNVGLFDCLCTYGLNKMAEGLDPLGRINAAMSGKASNAAPVKAAPAAPAAPAPVSAPETYAGLTAQSGLAKSTMGGNAAAARSAVSNASQMAQGALQKFRNSQANALVRNMAGSSISQS